MFSLANLTGLMNKYTGLLAGLLVVGLALYFTFAPKSEGFRLMFWQASPPSRNSSYDSRGDPFKIRMTKDNHPGIFYMSKIMDNHRRQNLPYDDEEQ